MRTFYIFKINKMFQTLYNDKSNVLYKIFFDIYYTKKVTKNLKLFEKIIKPFDKKNINNYILLRHSSDLYYIKKGNYHLINNEYETSSILINKTYIKIKSDINLNSFIKDIINYNEVVFVIDFKNKDYFWLNKETNKILV